MTINFRDKFYLFLFFSFIFLLFGFMMRLYLPMMCSMIFSGAF